MLAYVELVHLYVKKIENSLSRQGEGGKGKLMAAKLHAVLAWTESDSAQC